MTANSRSNDSLVDQVDKLVKDTQRLKRRVDRQYQRPGISGWFFTKLESAMERVADAMLKKLDEILKIRR